MRGGLLSYRPMRWSAERWNSVYASRQTDGYGTLDEFGRYSLLIGYISWLGPNLKLLDIGCGAGLLKRRVPRDLLQQYVGIDPTESAIEQAQAIADERSTFLLGDPMTMQLETFDVVVCSDVLYFAEEPHRLLDRVRDFIRPGGHLLVSIWRHPGDDQLWRWIDERYERLDRVALRNPTNPLAPRGWQVGCYRRPA